MNAAKIRKRSARLLGRLGTLRHFEATAVTPHVDILGEDPPATPGTPVRFRGAVSSLKTSNAGERRSITIPDDFRSLLASLPDEKLNIQEVDAAGDAVIGGLSGTIVGSPRAASGLALADGIGLTVIHVQTGASSA